VLLFQSRYAERLPIGKPDTIRSITVPQLRAFYDAWYRPDRMAVVAVGDIDSDALERAVATLFGGMTARASALPEPDRTVPLHKDLLISVVTDPEVTRSALEVVRKRSREDETHAADYRRQLVDRLVARMLNQRFAELAQKPDAKFLGATVSDRPLTEKVALFAAGAGVADGQLQEGLRVVASEGERARRYGFAASELDRAKKWLRATYDRAYLERDKTESASLASEYLRHFLVEEPAPGIEYEYRLVQQVLPGISLEDVKSAVQRLLTDESRVVLIVAPQKASVQVPSKEELTKALIDAERAPLEAWSDTSVSRELVDPKPHPGTIAARRTLDPLGITVVRFSNGIEAWLKPTDFRNDQILFTMEAPGGLSLSPAEDYLNASLATAYVIASGAGGLSATDLQKLLTGRQATAVPFVSLSTHGISGSATPGEIELALQLLYQEFMAPGDDEDAFALIKRRLDAAFANRGQSPQQVFVERVAQVNTSGHYTTAPVTPERIGTLDRRKMFTFYRDRFSNAADFRFVMVGAFKVDDVVPLLAQYVGSLPANGTRPSNFRDVGIRFPTSIQRVEVEKGREPRSQTLISFFAEPSLDLVQQENLTEAMTVLETRLRDVLRESLGQTYNVSVQLDQIFPQRGGGHVQVGFAAAPEHIVAMTERVLQEIKRLQQDGPSADLTNRAKAAARQNDDAALKQNPYWLRRLTIARVIGGDPSAILKRGERINAVTPETLRTAFRRYFPADRFTVVTLVPAR
jgi:zinc protease